MPYELLLKEGSPPRMRGKGEALDCDLEDLRITPACTGKRTRPRRWVRPPRDHPRVCGEKVPITCVPKYALGSPPRMRGKAAKSEDAAAIDRITPACAGKRNRVQRLRVQHGDHPRVCGEKPFPQLESTVPPGSPPRVRGKAVEMKLAGTVHGITPACAGKSSAAAAARICARDHPRVCEEKHLSGTTDNRPHGSPPRVRGKDMLQALFEKSLWITPACAGKRARPSPCRSQSRDHPRVCGEK